MSIGNKSLAGYSGSTTASEMRSEGCWSPICRSVIGLAILLIAVFCSPDTSAQVAPERRVYVYAVNNNGYGSFGHPLLHGSSNGHAVSYDTSANGYVTEDSSGNFSISGLYEDQCANAPTPATLLVQVTMPVQPATISVTYQLVYGSNTGTLTLNGTRDSAMPEAYDITSVTGNINGVTVSLVSLPAGTNSTNYATVQGYMANNVYYPTGLPSTGGYFDEYGLLLSDGTNIYNLYKLSATGTFPVLDVYSTWYEGTGSFTKTANGVSDPTDVQMSLLPVQCSQVGSLSQFTISPATTVAAAYALQPYANIPLYSFSTDPNGDLQGPSNALIASNYLVNGSTGVIPATFPYGGAVPAAKINALAGILSACINSVPSSPGVTTAECTNLFIAATPSGGTAPTNTLQAILDIARYPSNNVSNIQALPPASSRLPMAPADWSLPAKLPSSINVTMFNPTYAYGDNPAIRTSVTQVGGVWSGGTVSCAVTGGGTAGPLAIDSDGNAQLWVGAAGLPVGTDLVTCTYSGTSSRASSVSSYTVNITGSAPPPTSSLALSCTPNNLVAGQTASCTLTGLPSGATGSVRFTINGDLWTNVTVGTGSSVTAVNGLGLVAANSTALVEANYNGQTASASVAVSAATGTASTIYSYSITAPDGSSGYAANGNIIAYTDSVNGQWSLGYDSLNRLVSSTQTPTSGSLQYNCWSYDSFGNMQKQYNSNLMFSQIPGCQEGSGAVTAKTDRYYTDASNRISSGGWRNSTGNYTPGVTLPTYDDAGNMTFDLQNTYLYDAEGHVCAVLEHSGRITGYIYDAEGHRVAKGLRTDFTCDANPSDPAAFTITSRYVIGPDGEEMTETDASGAFVHTKVSANGQVIATYKNDGSGVHFQLADWLGTMRVQTTYVGEAEDQCTSQPFGDQLNCTHSELEGSSDHFTGKERDSESGLDNFGARYYASNVGRWMSPDWSASPSGIPYASLGDPQSLNLYGYVRNNPLSRADADGHCDPGQCMAIALGIFYGIMRDGGVKPYLKNVGTGIAKGLGSLAVNGAKLAAAGPNPGPIVAAMITPGPKALRPSNVTQAQASLATQIVVPAVAGMAAGPLLGAAGAGEVEASATLFHYGYIENESMFAGGLRAGSFATTDGGLTGAEAQSMLALPHELPPNAVYPVTPEPGTLMIGPTRVEPEFGQPGGGLQVQFPNGTGPGTVGAPKPIPPQ